MGYYKDPYIDSFAKNKQRRAPIMNRGYFGRVKAFQTLITRFINQHGQSNSQIVSLGAGFDTTYFLLKVGYERVLLLIYTYLYTFIQCER